MRLLLDTHTFIWYVTNNSRLSVTAQEIINEGNNDVLLSIASVWEMAIKHSTVKLNFTVPFTEFIERQIEQNSINLLQISIAHLNVIVDLPLHHRDPFDQNDISNNLNNQWT